MAHSYACTEFPGMEGCPGYFVAETDEEVLQLTELHARIAHGEDPAAWSPQERQQVLDLIRPA
ncbi:MAG TPA: DUF1059 domain-containing protein [Actinomycetota bacterium]|nr:DUF1059 domain-containing protein [Actinomycetota bacterium]